MNNATNLPASTKFLALKNGFPMGKYSTRERAENAKNEAMHVQLACEGGVWTVEVWVPFAPVEVAYRHPGKRWTRRVAKTQGALDRLLAMREDGTEVVCMN
jgi:hypothetical protein